VTRNFLLLLAGLLFIAVHPARAQQQPGSGAPAASGDAEVRKKIEGFFRNLYAWGPEVKLTVGPLKETGMDGLEEVRIDLALGEQKDSTRVYVTKDGRFIFRGEINDLSKDPLAATRAKLAIEGAPSLGDPKATVTVVEFADFQCPVCKGLHDALRTLLPKYPQARLIFKDFPLTQIHVWAQTASLAARCAYNQKPKAFWQFYDLIYADQQIISAENSWDKMLEYAGKANLDLPAFKACMASPEAAKAIQDSLENGQQLEVTSTPTVFVNGRRMVGADAHLLEQYIRYELEGHATKTDAKKE
jgi:protein-disulfide isomerase